MFTFTSARSFLLTLTAVFALLLTMWVSAASAQTLAPNGASCRSVGDGITMCDGANYVLPEAPRGAVRRLPRVSTYQVNTVRGASTVGARVGVTVVMVRMGARS